MSLQSFSVRHTLELGDDPVYPFVIWETYDGRSTEVGAYTTVESALADFPEAVNELTSELIAMAYEGQL